MSRGYIRSTFPGFLLILLSFQDALVSAARQYGDNDVTSAKIKSINDGELEGVIGLNSLLSPNSKRLRLARGTHMAWEQTHLDALGLDNIATVFSREAVSGLLRRAEERQASGADSGDGPDMEVAKVYARLTSVAYCSNTTVITAWNCTRCLRVPSFQIQDVVFDPKWDLLAFVGYLPAANAVVAVFRGTDSHSWGNWIENLRSWRSAHMWPIEDTGHGAPRAMVHAGFYNLWNKSELGTNVTAAIGVLMRLHPGAGLHVTGHSMGAAIAEICALDAKFKFRIATVRSFTFGSPRVGNRAFYDLFEQETEGSWRFTHGRDVVPSLPPTFIGYHHVAREVWTVDVDPTWPGDPPDLKAFVCDGSGEDPSCHNSACFLGLCTSIADHLRYLTYEMYHSDAEC